MFDKLVCLESAGRMDGKSLELLKTKGKEVVLHFDIPENDDEILSRIGDADGLLVSYTSKISAEILKKCPNLKYIGMCCSVYGPKSSNVDLICAEEMGITVTGVFDYGDFGVPEFVISQLSSLLHGFNQNMWKPLPHELWGLSTGLLGMGRTGEKIARALRFFGADVSYFSRTRKPRLEDELGIVYEDFPTLLPKVDVLCTALNTNVALMGQKEFELFGNGKIYINTSIAPGHDVKALEDWLSRGDNWAIADMANGIDPTGQLLSHPRVICPGKSSGMTAQAMERLGQKVINNIDNFFLRQ